MTIPPQSTPISEGSGLFSRTWWLFFNALISASANATVALPVWTVLPAFQNGWAAVFTGTNGVPSFTSDGRYVGVRGIISGGTQTNATLLWTFAAAQSPLFNQWAVVPAVNNSGVTLGYATILIVPGGQVLVYNIAALTTPNVTINFRFPIF